MGGRREPRVVAAIDTHGQGTGPASGRPAPVSAAPSPAPGPPERACGAAGSRTPRRRAVLTRGAWLPVAALLPVPALAVLSGCANGSVEVLPDEVRAEVPREKPPAATGLAATFVPFTARLLGALGDEHLDLCCSPASAQIALTLAALGAAGSTRAQLEDVLGAPVEDLARAANGLDAALNAVGTDVEVEKDDPDPPSAALANAAWVHDALTLEDAYLEDLSRHLDQGVATVDFTDDAERRRALARINGWVSDRTEGLIEDLVPEDSVSAATRLLLVNALHLRAAWRTELEVDRNDTPIVRDDGTQVPVRLLRGSATGWYEDDLCRATSLATFGDDLLLVLALPVGTLADLRTGWAERSTDPSAGLAALLGTVIDPKSGGGTDVALPPFEITTAVSLRGALEQLGLTDAFSGSADFSRITRTEPLAISAVLQRPPSPWTGRAWRLPPRPRCRWR